MERVRTELRLTNLGSDYPPKDMMTVITVPISPISTRGETLSGFPLFYLVFHVYTVKSTIELSPTVTELTGDIL